MSPELGKATYVVELESRGFSRDLKALRGEVDSTTTRSSKDFDQTSAAASGLDKTIGNMGTSFSRTSGTIRKTGKDTTVFRNKVVTLNASIGLLSKGLMLLKWPGFLAIGGIALQGINALASGVVALTSALAPLAGGFASVATAYTAMGQAMLAFKLSGVTKVFATLSSNATTAKNAMTMLKGPAKQFAQFLQQFKDNFQAIRNATARGIFSGAQSGIQSAMKNWGVFKDVMRQTGNAIGGVVKQFGQLLGSKGFGKVFGQLGHENVKLIGKMGDAARHLLDAFVRLLVAAKPLTNWLANLALGWTKTFDASMKSKQGMASATSFFKSTETTLKPLLDMIGNLWHALLNIGKIAQPFGLTYLRQLDSASQSFAAWTKSVEGQQKILNWFKAEKPALEQLGKLVHDLTIDLFKFGQGSNIADLLKMIRVQLLPNIFSLLRNTANRLGPELVTLLGNAAQLLGNLAGTSGPIILTMRTLNLLLVGINDLLKNKVIRTFAVWALTFAGVLKVATGLYGVLKKIIALEAIQKLTGGNSILPSFIPSKAASTATGTAETAAADVAPTSMAAAAALTTTGAPVLEKTLGQKLAAGLATGLRFAIPGAFAALNVGDTIMTAIHGDVVQAAAQGTFSIAGAVAGGLLGGPEGALLGSAVGGQFEKLIPAIFKGAESLGQTLHDAIFGGPAPTLEDNISKYKSAIKTLGPAQAKSAHQLAQASQRVRDAREKEHRADVNVHKAEMKYQDALKRFGPNSKQAINASNHLAKAREHDATATAAAQKANRLQGASLKAYEIQTKQLVITQGNLISSTKDKVHADREELNQAYRAWQQNKKSKDTQNALIAANNTYHGDLTSLSQAQEKQTKLIQQASDKAGPKFVKTLKAYRSGTDSLLNSITGLNKSGIAKNISAQAVMNTKLHQGMKSANLFGDQVNTTGTDINKNLSPPIANATTKVGNFTNAITPARKAWAKGINNISNNMKNLSTNVATAEQNIKDNTNKGLSAFQAKSVSYNIAKQASLIRSGYQRGGPVGGSGTGDKVPAMLEPGEYVLNRKAVRAVGAKRLDHINKDVAPRHMKKGGFVYPFSPAPAFGRVDMGVDYNGSSVIRAMGDAIVTSTSDLFTNAPGSGGVVYKLLGGAPAGFSPDSPYVYTYEGLSVGVRPGQRLKAGQPIGRISSAVPTGIEMGWADSGGVPLASGYYHEGDVTPPGSSMKRFVDALAHGKTIAGGAAAIAEHLSKVVLGGPAGPAKTIGQKSLDKQVKAANALLKKSMPKSSFMGSGTGSFPATKGGWHRVGATEEGLDGQQGAYGTVGGMGFAELLLAGANAGMHPNLEDVIGKRIPPLGKVAFRMPGSNREAIAVKNDIGSGQLGDGHYLVDIQTGLANAIGWHPNQDVLVKAAQKGGLVPSFAGGGHVAAPVGTPVPAVVHGGEDVLRPGALAALVSQARSGAAPGGGKKRYTIHIDNWHDGTGYMEEIADGAIDHYDRHLDQLSRMSR